MDSLTTATPSKTEALTRRYGAGTVPQAVQTALGDNIDLACQEFEPVG